MMKRKSSVFCISFTAIMLFVITKANPDLKDVLQNIGGNSIRTVLTPLTMAKIATPVVTSIILKNASQNSIVSSLSATAFDTGVGALFLSINSSYTPTIAELGTYAGINASLRTVMGQVGKVQKINDILNSRMATQASNYISTNLIQTENLKNIAYIVASGSIMYKVNPFLGVLGDFCLGSNSKGNSKKLNTSGM